MKANSEIGMKAFLKSSKCLIRLALIFKDSKYRRYYLPFFFGLVSPVGGETLLHCTLDRTAIRCPRCKIATKKIAGNCAMLRSCVSSRREIGKLVENQRGIT